MNADMATATAMNRTALQSSIPDAIGSRHPLAAALYAMFRNPESQREAEHTLWAPVEAVCAETAADLEVDKKYREVVWWNRARWARQALVTRGVLRSNSPNGIWELADNTNADNE